GGRSPGAWGAAASAQLGHCRGGQSAYHAASRYMRSTSGPRPCRRTRQARSFLQMAGVKQYQTDVAIVGAGGAGIAAGIEARDAGARVLVFEKDTRLGGAAIISGGGCLIVGSPLQEKHGIHDTPDLAFKDWIEWGGPSADVVWARYYIEHSLHDLYRWA